MPLVFVTKYRCGVLPPQTLSDLKNIFSAVCRDFEAELVEMNGEDDHARLLVHYPSKVSVSRLVNSLKGVSSRLLKKHHPELPEKYWKGKLWSPSCFAGSRGGAPLSVIKQYVEQQRKNLIRTAFSRK